MRKGVEVVAKKYLAIFLAVIIIFSSFSPVMVYAEEVSEEPDVAANSDNLNQAQAGIILAEFAKKFCTDHASETLYGFDGRYNAYRGIKTQNATWKGVNYGARYQFDCVGWICFAVHQSLKLGGEYYTEFAVPPGGGNIPYFTNGFECIKGNYASAYSTLSREEVEKTVQPGDILFCANGGPHVVLYVGDGKIVHSYHIELACEGLYDNKMHYTDYCAIGRIKADTASNIKRSNTTIEFGKVTGGVPISITNVSKNNSNKTNKDVKVTITASNNIKNISGSVTGSNGWVIDGKTAYRTYSSATKETVTVTSATGNSASKDVDVSNIDKTVGTLSVTYDPPKESGKTNKNVVATITCKDEDLQEYGGWTFSGTNKRVLKKTYSNTVSEKVTVKDALGNSKTQQITIDWIDKTNPTIQTTTITKVSSEEVKVTIVAGESVSITSNGNKASKITAVNQAKTKYEIIYRTNCTDTLTIKDVAGNSITQNITINQIDSQVDIGEPKFNPTDTTTPTNKNVTVTITANEDITITKASDRWKLNGRTITGTYSGNAAAEKITVKDSAGNTKTITIPAINNIDKKAPAVLKHDETTSSDGSVTINIVLNEEIKTVTGSGWAKSKNSTKTISKTFTKVQIDEIIENQTQESISVTDNAGNTFSFSIKAKLDDSNKIKVEILDDIPPILEKIIYGSSRATRDNIEVELEINEEVNVPDGWNIKEGSENTWILYKTYTNNTVNASTGDEYDYVSITDPAGNKIVGDTAIAEKVNDGKVRIKINNIDRIAPTVKTTKFTNKENDDVLVEIELSEYTKEKSDDWTSKSAPDQNTVYKTLKKNDVETFEVADFTGGNTTALKVDVANEKVTEIPLVELIEKSTTKKTKNDVTVKIVVNKEPQEIDGWTISKGQDGNAKYEGRWILEKTYEVNTSDEGEEVLIKDKDGNLAVGDSVENGKVHISITNIDKEELKVNNVYTEGSYTSKDDTICIEFNKEISIVSGSNWTVDHAHNKHSTIYKTFTKAPTESETVKVKDSLKNVIEVTVTVTYDEATDKYTAVASSNNEEYTDDLIRIEIKQVNEKNNRTYYQGDLLDVEGLTISAIYRDETSENGEKSVDIKYEDGSEIEIAKEGSNPSKTIKLTQVGSQKKIIVSYEGKTASFPVTVKEINSTEYEIDTENAKTNYTVGDEINTEGIVVYQKYNNGNKTEVTEEFEFTPSKFTKIGNQIITVTSNGEEIGEYTVYVTEDEINIISWPEKVNYNVGETVDTEGLKVEKKDAKGNVTDITNEIQCIPTEFNQKGTHTIILTYKGAEIGEYDVEVNKAVKEIKIVNQAETLKVNKDDINLEGLKLLVTYVDDEQEEISEGYKYSEITYNEKGEPIIQISYGGKTVDLSVSLLENEVTKLEIIQKPTKLEYYRGDTLEISGIKLVATYANNETENLDENDSIIWTPNTLRTVGTQTITVIYEGQNATFDVTVKREEDTNNYEPGAVYDDENKDDNKNLNSNTNQDNNANKDNNTDNANQGNNTDGNNNTNQNDNNVSDKSTSGDADTPKDTTTSPSGYKDANTANSRLPQTGVTQIIIVMLVACAVVSGALFIKYRKI